MAGEAAGAQLVYTGVTRPGAGVRGFIALYGDTYGLLGVRGTAGEGGTYSGVVTP